MELIKKRKDGFLSNFLLWNYDELQAVGAYTAKEFKKEIEKTIKFLNPKKCEVNYDFGDGYEIDEIPESGLFTIQAACIQKNGAWIVFEKAK